MKLALCGFPPLAEQLQTGLQGFEFKYFIGDFVSTRGRDNFPVALPPISFFDFRRLINAGELDGVIIAEDGRKPFTREVIRGCKFYGIPKVGVTDLTFFNSEKPVRWLNPYKIFLPYLESDITDRCNLNCRGCCHFANFRFEDEFYPLENYRRDLNRIAQTCDVFTFCLLGGEPFILNNIERYLLEARQCFPYANLGIFTNGLLIPSLPKKILDILREAKFTVLISAYPPTIKSLDKIKTVIDANSISCRVIKTVENFSAQMTLTGNNNPAKAINACRCGQARSIRNGKIYKCPIDSACYKFAKKFNIKKFASPTGVDIYAENFSSLLEVLDGSVELCGWCAEQHRQIPWEPTNNPKLEDWLADPAEAKALR